MENTFSLFQFPFVFCLTISCEQGYCRPHCVTNFFTNVFFEVFCFVCIGVESMVREADEEGVFVCVHPVSSHPYVFLF